MLVSVVQQSKPVTHTLMKVKVKFTQSCPTLCDPLDYTVHGISQARILEWVAMPSCRGFSQPRELFSELAGRFFTTSTTWKAT